ncbi:hypothetical protein CPL00376_CDS0060 [Klebsiella phage SlimeyKevin]
MNNTPPKPCVNCVCRFCGNSVTNPPYICPFIYFTTAARNIKIFLTR